MVHRAGFEQIERRCGRFAGSLVTGQNQTRRSLFPNEISYRNVVAHLSESVLEEYAMGRLSRYRVERVEEHVHSCRECRERLDTEIEIVVAMKAATKIGRAQPTGNALPRRGAKARSGCRGRQHPKLAASSDPGMACVVAERYTSIRISGDVEWND